jgi:outer membrane lipoprotein-sorting protein
MGVCQILNPLSLMINPIPMKIKLILSVLTISTLLSFAPPKTGEDIVKMMYNRYAGKWHRTLTFTQKTERYRNDSLKSTQTWHEAMLAPDKLRIDIEPLANGNTIIFRGDSTYNFRNGQLRSASKDENDLIFLLGGLYFYPWDAVVAKLKSGGYDLSKSYETTWKDKPVYVIGSNNKDDLTSNQLWVDKKELYLVRMIEQTKGTKEECIFDDHVKIGGGWSETKAAFYFGGKLLQVETYSDYKEEPDLDERIFDPKKYEKRKL